MLSKERATLFAIAVTDCISNVLKHHFQLRSFVQTSVFPILSAAYRQEPKQLLGLLISILGEYLDLVEDQELRKSIQEHITRQKTPLFGARDPGLFVCLFWCCNDRFKTVF
jgi:hypothetical protein